MKHFNDEKLRHLRNKLLPGSIELERNEFIRWGREAGVLLEDKSSLEIKLLDVDQGESRDQIVNTLINIESTLAAMYELLQEKRVSGEDIAIADSNKESVLEVSRTERARKLKEQLAVLVECNESLLRDTKNLREYRYEAGEGIKLTSPTTKTVIPKNRPEPTLSEMFGQLDAVNKKLEDWIDANLTPMTMYKRCLAAYGKVWSNIDDLDKPINSEPALEATGRLCKDLITWAEITGVCSEEKVSLNYNTYTSPKLRNQVLNHVLKPLHNIEAALKTMAEIAEEKAAPGELLASELDLGPDSGSARVPTTKYGSLSYPNSQKIRLTQESRKLVYNQSLLGI
ncbi:uncharacterized protein J4E87_004317 [Alternaria ethzedia]|uniref:uncharacterized protein n=1 Tax=Alternaria ethzedia TaxID=181014 RepID=UPI0020C2C3F5|nr:uncharacterized protein J4E87_004317 [Alternaria ethzedia]KAI4626976.1 hypothetical protein J4E87_004317 [Alternaria ethzedia]